MPYFAYCPRGIVERVERIEPDVMSDKKGTEKEALGQQFLASIYPDTEPAHFVMTHYPVGQPDPFPRGKYAGLADTWDGSIFATPEPIEPVIP